MSSLTTRHPEASWKPAPLLGRWQTLWRRWLAARQARRVERQWREMDSRILVDIGMGDEGVRAARAHRSARW